MRFTATFQLPTIDLARYRASLKVVMQQAVAEAARAWLGAVTAIVPVWSGAARATFVKLANEVAFNVPISPVAKKDRQSLGTESSEGSLIIDEPAGFFGFQYGTSLAHLIENELGSPSFAHKFKTPTPYQFAQAGQQAFLRFASQVSLPDPFRDLHLSTVSI